MGSLGFSSETLPILWVALITWGGVLFYLIRLDRLSKQVEDEVRAHESHREDAPSPSPQPPASAPR